MSFFTDDELQRLKIDKMILHVVGEKVFLPQSQLAEVQQEEFFLDRINEINATGIFAFKPESSTKRIVESMATGAQTFEAGGQELAQSFSKSHAPSSTDGAFFVFELRPLEANVKLYAMFKIDYKSAIERTRKNGALHLRKIVDAFIEDRKVVQKSCLIKVTGGIANTQVSAKDRIGKSPNLTDYFEDFLGVRRDRSDDDLNHSALEAVRNAINQIRHSLPEGNVRKGYAIAKDALRVRQEIDADAIRDALLSSVGENATPECRALIDKTVAKQVKDHRLSGLSFKPNAKIFSKSPRQRWKTKEGVFIEFPTELEGVLVKRVDHDDGSAVLTIETSGFEDATLLADKARP